LFYYQQSDKLRLIRLAVDAGSPYPIIEAWDRGFDNIDWVRIETLANTAAKDWEAAARINRPEDHHHVEEGGNANHP